MTGAGFFPDPKKEPDMIPTATSYRLLLKNYDQQKAKVADSKAVQTDIDYFKKTIQTLPSVEAIFKDPKLIRVLTSALNLGGEEKYPGKLRQILMQKVDDPASVMNRLPDKRYKQAAQTLKLAETGLNTLKSAGLMDAIEANYKQAAFDQSISKQDPALREALYFSKFAEGASDNIWELLGDPIIRKVVTKTLGIPERFAIQPLETQASAVTRRLDIAKLADPKFRDKFIERYLNAVDAEKRAAGGGEVPWQSTLFSGQRGLSTNLLV